MAADHIDEMNLYGLDLESRQMVIDMVAQLRKKLLTQETILELDKKELEVQPVCIRQKCGSGIPPWDQLCFVCLSDLCGQIIGWGTPFQWNFDIRRLGIRAFCSFDFRSV